MDCCNMDAYYQENEDDIFADIRRQILLLTMDEEEEDVEQKSPTIINKSPPPLTLQLGCSGGWTKNVKCGSPLMPADWDLTPSIFKGNDSNNGGPLGVFGLKSRGTGVFIPNVQKKKPRRSRGGKKKRQWLASEPHTELSTRN